MGDRRVLVVDDEEILRMVAVDFLRDEGLDVVEAASGQEAVDLLTEAGPFDALFTDVRMSGGIDGVELAIRARRIQPSIPILVVSGFSADLTDRLAALRPVVVFKTKPYELSGICRLIQGLAEMGAAGGASPA